MKKVLLVLLLVGMFIMPIRHRISNPFTVTVERML